MTTIAHASSDRDIAATFDVMHQLRPHLDRERYVDAIRGMMHSDGLQLLCLSDDDGVRAVATYRLISMLYCGRILSVDDLVTDASRRSQGYGGMLVNRLEVEAIAHGCSEIQLISRVTREHAHRFYFRVGFGIECFHFRKKLG